MSVRSSYLVSLTVTALIALPVAAQAPSTARKPLAAADLQAWKTIRAMSLTPDGRWFAYTLVPNEGDGEVVVRPTGEGAERRFPIGQSPAPRFVGFGVPVGPPSLAVSGDGRWLAFLAYPTAAAQRQLRKERKPVQSRAVLVDLASGATREFPKVQRFAFAGDTPAAIVFQSYPPDAAPAGPPSGAAAAPGRSTGVDLLYYELGTGSTINIGNVGDFAFDESGEWLALTIDARDRLGNGVHVRNTKTGVTRVLESQDAFYRRLQWADSGLALSALRGVVDSAAKDTSYVALGFTGVGAATAGRVVISTQTVDSAVPGLRVSPDRAPTWARNLSQLYFGVATAPVRSAPRPDVKPVAGTPGAMQRPSVTGGVEEDSIPSLVIWHAKDSRLQARQQVQETADKAANFLALYRVADRRIIQLGSDSLAEVTVAPGDRWAIGADRRAYERADELIGPSRRDVYAIDLTTGASSRVLTEQQFVTAPSPDGARLAYYADGDYRVYEFATGTHRNLTAGLPVSFVNVEDDHNVDRPPRQFLGWVKDGGSVLLSDGWDIWRVPVRAGASAVNLTGDGRAEGIRYRNRLVWDPKERGIDLSIPQYVQAYGERTKRTGLARIAPNGKKADRLLWDDAAYMVTKARRADTFLFTRQTFTQFPDYWVTGRDFAAPRRLTDANPQQQEYVWSPGARLVDYVTDKGDSLQAALFLPAGYEEGKTYPTVVYIYERLSQSLHQYATPNETTALNPSVYTSAGYAVLMPDIVYRINDPGMSALWAVVPATKAAIATGIVDASKVGLHGHSWGGYQTAFLVTQTDLFAGAIAGAPLTDMVSMYSSVYWNTGGPNQGIFVSSQGRFKGNYLDNYDAYIRNSPAFHAKNVKTPLMLLHNEKDGAVDFNQGITFYNTLRELGKDVILLQYVGENHGLAQPRNQKDYAGRMREFFDHHLKGVEASDWLKDGIPRLKMEEHLKARQQKPALIP